MKIIPIALGIALLLPLPAIAKKDREEEGQRPKRQKEEKQAKAPKMAQPGRPERGPGMERGDRGRGRVGMPPGQQRKAEKRERAYAAAPREARREMPAPPRMRDQSGLLENNRRNARGSDRQIRRDAPTVRIQTGRTAAARPQLALRNWNGPGNYDGRYWQDRPRYNYNGASFFFGSGPLPFYNNYDDLNPRYDVIYTEGGGGRRVVTRGGGDSDLFRNAQSALAEKGFYRGEIDGQFGPSSQRALRAFQRSTGLPATGELDPETTARLGV